ncbi:cytochrome P450 [Gymnopilus junonius]|uniref:Cytochrome P450 n=1 Tax=Gymnopilus junonius TaxID=109634 RepID=A0A9P5NKE5_GYMJU|nr:cytochrome P450 [Gymnopilus junonius]
MLNHPHIMRKAQEEIDNVIGAHRFLEFQDWHSLPYTRAVIKETMSFPLGVPHEVGTDDEYEKMHIPHGSSLVANAYLISKDEKLFPSPDKFKPERFLEIETMGKYISPEAVNSIFIFGFGRCICPRIHIA